MQKIFQKRLKNSKNFVIIIIVIEREKIIKTVIDCSAAIIKPLQKKLKKEY